MSVKLRLLGLYLMWDVVFNRENADNQKMLYLMGFLDGFEMLYLIGSVFNTV